MKHTLVSLVAAAALGTLWIAPAIAQNDLYIFDMPQKHPAAYRAYKNLLPKSFKKVSWIYRLDGTATPVDEQIIGGVNYLTGTVCKPHDCGDNIIAILVTASGSRAVALLRSVDLSKGNDRPFGHPSPEELDTLKALLN